MMIARSDGLPSTTHVWNDVPDRYLSEAELTQYRSGATEQGRKQWSLGRLAAKGAVRRRAEELALDLPDCNQIEVLNDASGRPYIHAVPDDVDRAVANMPISIAHDAGVGACTVSRDAQQRVGIDVQQVTSVPAGLKRWFAAADETRRLSGMPPELPVLRPELAWTRYGIVVVDGPGVSERPGASRIHAPFVPPAWQARYTALWALKEAASKALGVGLALPLVWIRLIEVHGACARMRLATEARRHPLGRTLPHVVSIAGRVWRHGGALVAWVSLRDDADQT